MEVPSTNLSIDGGEGGQLSTETNASLGASGSSAMAVSADASASAEASVSGGDIGAFNADVGGKKFEVSIP